MLHLFLQALPTLVVGGMVLAALAATVRKLLRDKKQRKGGCGGGCCGCPHASGCHSA